MNWAPKHTAPLRGELADGYAQWRLLSIYGKFEHAVILVLTALIALVIIAAVWSLALDILFGLMWSNSFDPTDHRVFQSVFGRIFTVIIALEFKRSLLIVSERRDSVVHIRAVISIALLAIIRKLIILDLGTTDGFQLLGLAATILSVGGVFWLLRRQDRPRPLPVRKVYHA
jgi:uncharacterized membrane protein (DUF373 family)